MRKPDGRRGEVFSIRLTNEARALIERACEAPGVPFPHVSFARYHGGRYLGEFLRAAALVVARRIIDAPPARGWANRFETALVEILGARTPALELAAGTTRMPALELVSGTTGRSRSRCQKRPTSRVVQGMKHHAPSLHAHGSTLCGAKSPNVSAALAEVNCRTCLGWPDLARRAIVAWHERHAAAPQPANGTDKRSAAAARARSARRS